MISTMTNLKKRGTARRTVLVTLPSPSFEFDLIPCDVETPMASVLEASSSGLVVSPARFKVEGLPSWIAAETFLTFWGFDRGIDLTPIVQRWHWLTTYPSQLTIMHKKSRMIGLWRRLGSIVWTETWIQRVGGRRRRGEFSGVRIFLEILVTLQQIQTRTWDSWYGYWEGTVWKTTF